MRTKSPREKTVKNEVTQLMSSVDKHAHRFGCVVGRKAIKNFQQPNNRKKLFCGRSTPEYYSENSIRKKFNNKKLFL